jgi:hypothetical protein
MHLSQWYISDIKETTVFISVYEKLHCNDHITLRMVLLYLVQDDIHSMASPFFFFKKNIPYS